MIKTKIISMFIVAVLVAGVGGYVGYNLLSAKKDININSQPLKQESSTKNGNTGSNNDQKTSGETVSEVEQNPINTIINNVGTAVNSVIPDIFKSPKQIYLESEARELGRIQDALSTSSSDNPTKQVTEISAGVSGLPAEDPISQISDILKDSKLVLDTSTDPVNNLGYLQLKAYSNNAEAFGLDLFTTKDKIALRVPSLYDKYIYANFKDRDKVAEKFGIDLSSLPNLAKPQDLSSINVDKNKIKALIIKYGKIYADNIKDDQVTIENGVFTAGSAQVKDKEITVVFTEAELKNLLDKMADQLANDNQFTDLIYEEYQASVTSAGNAVTGAEPLDKAQLKGAILEYSRELKAEVNAASWEKGLTMELCVDDHHNILKRTITWEQQNKQNCFQIEHWNDGGSTNTSIKFDGYLADNKLNFNALEQKLSTSRNQTINVQFQINPVSTEQAEAISGTFNSTQQIPLNPSQASITNDNFAINLKMPSEGLDNITVKLNVKQTTNNIKTVTVPTLQPYNSLNLADASDAQIAELQQRIDDFFAAITGPQPIPGDLSSPPTDLPGNLGLPPGVVPSIPTN